MKITQLSIELFIVPVRKVISLFYVYLKIQLSDTNEKGVKLDECIYTEDNMNMIDKGLARLFESNLCKTEQFYQRNIINSTDSPLAQIIVVGLLRTMLTTCATNNKYNPQSSKPFSNFEVSYASYFIEGIDLNREWECSGKMTNIFKK